MNITVHNYRKKFKEYYGIDFSRDYDVHHIDLNHENNDISNLMVLPKKLHRRYHMALSWLMPSDGYVKMGYKICSNEVSMDMYMLARMEEFVKVMRECAKWRDYKWQLDMKKWRKEQEEKTKTEF